MQRLENWETNWFFNHCTFFSCFSKPEKNWNLCYWRRFDMTTSKSVRRNVTRSWGLSLEKIEFFSTDFLWRWLDFSYASAGHPSIHLHLWSQIIMFSSKTICRHLFSSKNCSIFEKKNPEFWILTPFCFCFHLPIQPHSKADFYQNSPGFVYK